MKITKSKLNPLCQRLLGANLRKGWVSLVKGISVFKNGVDNKNSLQLLPVRGTSYRKSVCIDDLVFARANFRRELCS